jgi:hypothetical protein
MAGSRNGGVAWVDDERAGAGERGCGERRGVPHWRLKASASKTVGESRGDGQQFTSGSWRGKEPMS